MMQLRFFAMVMMCGALLFLGSSAFSQTDESLDKELNAAESAAGGDFKPIPGPKELKSDGDTLDAIGIPSETENKPMVAATPPPQVNRPIVKSVPPPVPAQPPAPAVREEPPPPAPPEELPPPETDSMQVETPIPEPAPTPADKQTAENQKICNCRFKPGTPYRDRRSRFTGLFGIEAGTYAPVNFNSQEISGGPSYSSLYSANLPNIEVVFGTKFNFLLGSLAAQFSGGYFSASNTGQSATLTVTPLTLGLTYGLDTIFKEPYVVPYFTGGLYTDIWKEVAQGLTAQGRTGFGPFFAIGLLFQLDWMDTETHETGYRDFGLENTFVFLEARSFLATDDGPIDFSTPLQVSGGFKFEF
jgi:hypothetical protein